MLKLLSLCSLIVISLLDGSVADILQSRHRSKRFLTFPPTTPTRVQVTEVSENIAKIEFIRNK